MADDLSVFCPKELVDLAVEDILRGVTANHLQTSPEELPPFTLFVVPSDDKRDEIISTLNL